MIYCYLLCLITVCCGLYFFPFGGVKRLKGIKNLSERERSEIKLKALGVNVAAMLYVLAAIFAIAGAAAFFREHLFVWFVAGWLVAAAADAAYISKSGHYFKKK